MLELLAGLRAAMPAWSLGVIAPAEGPVLARAASLGVDARVVPFPRRLALLGDAGEGEAGGRARLLARLAAAAPDVAAYAHRLHAALRAAGADVVHAHGLKAQLLAGWARPPGSAVVWHLHDYAGARPLMGALLRRARGRCDRAIAVSASVAEDARRLLPGVEVVAVHNAVDLDAFSPDGPALDLAAAAGLPPEPPGTVRVGLVATTGRWKGHETFLRALSLLPPEAPVRGFVVGGPIYTTQGSQSSLDALRAIAAGLGLGDRVGFTGFVAEPAAAMRGLDVVVNASTQPEPFGLVIVEGMATGKAVVASRRGGAGELFRDGVEAIGVEPGDAGALAAALLRLAGDAELRRRLGEAGRAAAVARFGRARLAAETLAAYAGLVPAEGR